ncbi:NAD(P)H-dependent oxidoreductase [Companilactobacillus alimentarius]|uniref:Flavodoxin n=1 Tax=Companilactobacillus alimentarius DSM 20249 TaxID=1423720 RepID=A0A2K9HHA9_9LACO|nr:NAD(P)H-dependent oxidoreductase [Companilactobacillus alimentarius]AUI71909.1 flavodoxin [Companilactobacillus alimentarius DSM 20249]KRK76793.1 flavodoxin [Companilactobacillus alimentarius DSM 20249]MDT6952434.1 NAD(P)H-dependent oxidoreductase [Companilactobacillus alimentarius]GEO45341.1 NAD(P)H dehydrogenase [Companilactobacillus alimentarius]
MKTIIYAHPNASSFNHEILNRLSNHLSRNDEEYQIIDLYEDGFDPVLSAKDLATYSQGKTHDPLVKKYQRQILNSSELIFIFPIWWHNMPAMLKGFFDKVMLSGFAYDETAEWKGLLTNIERAVVITTSATTKDYLVNNCGDPIQNVFIKRTLVDVGLNPKETRWIHVGKVNQISADERQKFLNNFIKQYENKIKM